MRLGRATARAGHNRQGRIPVVPPLPPRYHCQSVDARAERLLRPEEDRREENDKSEEEAVVESDDEGSEASSVAVLCEPDAGSDEDPTFDPDADGDLEVEAVLRARMGRISISASARKGRKGSAVPKMGKEEIDLLAMVDRLKQDGQMKKLKVYECKAYLQMHKLRLTGKKEVLLNRIREHIEVKNDGKEKYPVSSFLFNCKGDACKGDVVMFEQNIYRRKKGAPRGVKGHLCGQRTNAGRIIKESYGTAKQQHTFTKAATKTSKQEFNEGFSCVYPACDRVQPAICSGDSESLGLVRKEIQIMHMLKGRFL
ncbi:unnamed protein product [Urochloa humidicola]